MTNHITQSLLRQHLLIEEESALIEQATLALQRRHTNRYQYQSVAAVLDAFLALGFAGVVIKRAGGEVVVDGISESLPGYLQEAS